MRETSGAVAILGYVFVILDSFLKIITKQTSLVNLQFLIQSLVVAVL